MSFLQATFCGSSLGKKKGFHFSAADFESMGYDFCDTLLDYCDPDTSKVTSFLLYYHVYTAKLQWLEHLWNPEKMFETGVVQADEC